MEDFDDSYCSSDKDAFNIAIIFSLIAIGIFAIVIIVNTIDIVQNIYMPELTILNYVRNFNT